MSGVKPGTAKSLVALALAVAATAAAVSALSCRRSPAAPIPPADGWYRLPLTDNPISLDPAVFTDVNSEGVARRIFSALVRLDSSLQPAPDLAESWDVSADGLVYTFHLRKGVRFHNGRELTSDDVRFSFERLLRPGVASNRPWVVQPILGARALREGRAESLSGLETPDPLTVRVTLQEPYAPFLQQIAMTNAAIVPKEETAKAGEPFGRRPVGTGPFRFVRWDDNNVIELARNDDWFMRPPPLAGLRFRVIKEALVSYQEYVAGHLEHCVVPEGYLDEVRKGPLAAELQDSPTLSTWYIGVMMTHDQCGGNVHLRRAMNYAVDRSFLCEKVLGGAQVPARGVLPPGMPGHDPDFDGFTFDPDAARDELRQGGFSPAKPVDPLVLCYNSRPPYPQIAQALQTDLGRVGIRLRLQPMDFGALTQAINNCEPDLFYRAWVADFADPDNFLSLFHTDMLGAAGNRARYSDPEADALIAAARREPDPAKRIQTIRQAERRIVDEAPWIFISHGRTLLLVKPYVKGLRIGPMDAGASVNQVDFGNVAFVRPAPQ